VTLVPRLPEHAGRSIGQFLEAHVENAGASGVVVGLSGGIDSALTAHLARDALGARRVTGVLLPDKNFPSPLEDEIESFAPHHGVGTIWF
jgi:NAD+ synthase